MQHIRTVSAFYGQRRPTERNKQLTYTQRKSREDGTKNTDINIWLRDYAPIADFVTACEPTTKAIAE